MNLGRKGGEGGKDGGPFPHMEVDSLPALKSVKEKKRGGLKCFFFHSPRR